MDKVKLTRRIAVSTLSILPIFAVSLLALYTVSPIKGQKRMAQDASAPP